MSRLWLFAGLAVGAILLAIAARHIDFGQSMAVLRDTDAVYALLAVLGSLLFLYVKAWRWALLLSPLRHSRASELVSAVSAGTAANLIVPHAGEFARVLIVGNATTSGNRPAPAALLASIAVERVFDFAAVLALLGIVFVVEPDLPSALVSASMIAGIVFLVLLASALFVTFRAGQALRLLGAVLRPLPQPVQAYVHKHAAAGIDGLAALRQAHVLAKVGAVSLLQWATVVAAILWSVCAVGEEGSLPAAIAVLALMVVGLTLPAAPIYLGTTQMGFVVGLAAFGVGGATAIAASVIYTVFCLLPMLLVGAFCFYRHGLNLSTLRAA